MIKISMMIIGGATLFTLIAPGKAKKILQSVTGKIKGAEDQINEKARLAIEKIESTAEAIHRDAMA